MRSPLILPPAVILLLLALASATACDGGGGGAGGHAGASGPGGTGGMAACVDGMACYDGPPETRNVGICTNGTATCSNGQVVDCAGQVLPVIERCATLSDDENCDGEAACTGALLAFNISAATGGEDYGHRVAIAPGGDVVVAGTESAITNMGAYEDARMFLARFGPDGKRVVDKRSYGNGVRTIPWGLAVDPAGDVVISGQFAGDIDFGGGNVLTSTLDDLFLVKVDSTLNTVWAKAFDASGAGGNIGWSRVAIDPKSGNIVIAGDFSGSLSLGGSTLTATMQDVFIAAFDPGGNHLWSTQLPGPLSQLVRGVAIDPAGNVIVAGSFTGSIDLGQGLIPSNGLLDMYVAKRDGATGAPVWGATFGDALSERVSDIAVSLDGTILFAGAFRGTFALGSTMLSNPTTRDTIVVAALTSDGTPVWGLQAPSPAATAQEGTAVAVDAAGELLVAGYATGPLGFCPDPEGIGDAQDAFVAKLAPDGTCQWAFRKPWADYQAAFGVTADALGNVFATGGARTLTGYQDGHFVTTQGIDAFVVKLRP